MLIGNAPCSWGVFYPTGNRLTAEEYLDAVARAGYRATELGPLGFLPDDPAALADALASRALTLAGAAHVHVLAEPGSWPVLRTALDRLGSLLSRLDAPHLALMDESEWYPPGQPGVVDQAGWRVMIGHVRDSLRYVTETYGVRLTFHPHVGTCVEREAQIDRLLQDTEVDLCFDTGHHAFWDQDAVAYMRKVWDRIGYMHLKNVDPAMRARVLKGELGPNESFAQGVMCPLPDGAVDIAAVIALLKEKAYEGPCIVEQDPSDNATETPEALAARNLIYLQDLLAR
ncbi:sugar phosphate isomerase/epimerase family protein [Aestuariivirga sp. YIM B02566]|uniref:TIM barrel protein n=1 Tax=Taklimakanibacter albus TaxID=2800327 RepID=A0ACC5R2U8_9HYPH|nr:sugar phosphate isomerase/epimerase [Aestuariivirga sp. YIM B02566]MBK1866927.1 TIM barrel protein [Aestuariivirga sp. YIM B02566]